MLIQKEVLRDKIFNVLKGWILDGTLQPGERIVELTLARQLNVSRAPFREALWLLARQGLVDIRAHHGATVTELSEQSIREIFEVREVLEIHAAKRIRARLDRDVATRLREALRLLEEAARGRDIKAFSAADLKFHRTLWELAGNRHLQETLEDVATRFFGYVLIRDVSHADRYQFDAVVREHRKMVELILKGTDREIEAGFRKSFAAFFDYVRARLAPGGKGKAPARAASRSRAGKAG